MKRVLVLTLALVLAVTTMITGTVAYLTSVDQDVNVMTVGNVEIKQHELQRAEGVKHNATAKEGDLVDFVQGQPLYPAVALDNTAYTAEGLDNMFYWGPYVHTGTAGNGLWNDEKLFGALDKMIFVENTGDSDCYYRTWIAFECPEGMEYSQGSDKEFMMNVNGSTLYQWETIGYTKIGDTRYLVECATYVDALEPGELSHPSLLQVVMTHRATSEDMELLGDSYEILALTQAVQTNNMTEAYAKIAGTAADTYGSAAAFALTTAFGKEMPWTDADAIPANVANSEEFQAALAEDKTNIYINLTGDVTYDVAAWADNAMGGASTKAIIINGNGHTVTFNQTDSDWDNIVTANGAKLVLSNVNITNSGYNDGPWNRHDLNFACDVEMNNVKSDKAIALKAGASLNNVEINDKNTSDTYAIWIQPNGQTVSLNNVTIDMLDCTDGRGIKIDEQYVSAPEKVTLKVANTTFKTEEKSAIIVKSAAGADIFLNNVDITGVAADTTNAVWVDEASTAYADLVKVSGGTKINEGN